MPKWLSTEECAAWLLKAQGIDATDAGIADPELSK